MKDSMFIAVILLAIFFLFGCADMNRIEPTVFESMLEVSKALIVANTASTPVNPYALPIGIGLAGITAMLEALRRKERAGRKHAEHELNGNNNNN